MNNLATRLAVLALFGAMAAATPAFAQATPKTNCLNPDGTTNPFCVNQQNQQKQRGGPGFNKGGNDNNGTNTDQTPGRHRPGNNDNNNNDNNNNNNNNFDNNNNDHGNNNFNNDNGPSNGRHRDQGNRPDFGQGQDNNGGPGFGGPDRNQFRQHFRDFHFSPFPRPDFDVRPGYRVPRHFGLRPLPPALFRFYPYYRGFLFFETPDGQIVIVDPRTYRIIDII